jgi:hypothetical protein
VTGDLAGRVGIGQQLGQELERAVTRRAGDVAADAAVLVEQLRAVGGGGGDLDERDEAAAQRREEAVGDRGSFAPRRETASPTFDSGSIARSS